MANEHEPTFNQLAIKHAEELDSLKADALLLARARSSAALRAGIFSCSAITSSMDLYMAHAALGKGWRKLLINTWPAEPIRSVNVHYGRVSANAASFAGVKFQFLRQHSKFGEPCNFSKFGKCFIKFRRPKIFLFPRLKPRINAVICHGSQLVAHQLGEDAEHPYSEVDPSPEKGGRGCWPDKTDGHVSGALGSLNEVIKRPSRSSFAQLAPGGRAFQHGHDRLCHGDSGRRKGPDGPKPAGQKTPRTPKEERAWYCSGVRGDHLTSLPSLCA